MKTTEQRARQIGSRMAFAAASIDGHQEGMTQRQFYKAHLAAGLMAARAADMRLNVNFAELSAGLGKFADALLAEDAAHEQEQR